MHAMNAFLLSNFKFQLYAFTKILVAGDEWIQVKKGLKCTMNKMLTYNELKA